MFKKHVQKKLEKYVKKYFLAHPEVKLIVVAGSVGKTSTKVAVAEVLAQQYRVRMSLDNLNTEIGAPMGILGIGMPENIRSMKAWRRVFKTARNRIKSPTDVDVIVQEIGADKPGDIAAFAQYLRPYIAVVTAVTPEHMAEFGTIDAVAEEEITAANIAETAIINRDDIDGEHFSRFLINPTIFTYGYTDAAEYSFEIDDFDIKDGYKGKFKTPGGDIAAEVHVLGDHSIRPVTAAVAVGVCMQVPTDKIAAGVAKIRPVAGRMGVLRGMDETLIIDDSYNSSPAAAAAAALNTLYTVQSPARIAVLGDMNELGESSAVEHQAIGKMCDPDLLAWVVTVGKESGRYLAPVAKQNGCQVESFENALQAGAFVHKVLEPGAIVLFKGSQNGVFLEEAIKMILHSTEEEADLVRQTPGWMQAKKNFFDSFEQEVPED